MTTCSNYQRTAFSKLIALENKSRWLLLPGWMRRAAAWTHQKEPITPAERAGSDADVKTTLQEKQLKGCISEIHTQTSLPHYYQTTKGKYWRGDEENTVITNEQWWGRAALKNTALQKTASCVIWSSEAFSCLLAFLAEVSLAQCDLDTC